LANIPTLDALGMADLDRKMIEEYHVDLLMMMENAGKALAVQSKRLLGTLTNARILVLAGKGNNGGGGLVAARHIHNWGGDVDVGLSSPANELKEIPARQAQILEAMGLRLKERIGKDEVGRFDLIIDALLGYNQSGPPRGRVGELVDLASASQTPTLALDVPTGLDPDTGTPYTPCIRAKQTLTLALPKTGLLKSEAKPYVGRLFLADISVPREIYAGLGIVQASLFAADYIIPIN
jgi:NAD(P)H-hydrate epimerase